MSEVVALLSDDEVRDLSGLFSEPMTREELIEAFESKMRLIGLGLVITAIGTVRVSSATDATYLSSLRTMRVGGECRSFALILNTRCCLYVFS